jgi:uncharacterized membrane protein YphA (DoxX/SURF4 family)
LLLSVVMIALEIIAGVAVIIGWQMRFFSWLLLLMIVFFTFLTGYAWLATKPDGSPKFTNCGCFGDCLPITPDISFTKDIILTALILLLFFFRRKITSALSKRSALLAMLTVTVISFGVQWYTLSYLPVLDCLPFKKGNNIAEQMKMPANAIPDSSVITFIYDKDGKQVEFTASNFPKDFSTDTYKNMRRYDKLIRKGKNNVPPIKGFTLVGTDDTDSAQYVLSKPYAILLFAEDFSTPVKEWSKRFSAIYKKAKQKNIPVYMATTKYDDALKAVAGTDFSEIQIFKCDVTNVRTAARSNPCLFILQKGTIEGKWSARQFGKAETVLTKIAAQPIEKISDPEIQITPGIVNATDSNQIKTDTTSKN